MYEQLKVFFVQSTFRIQEKGFRLLSPRVFILLPFVVGFCCEFRPSTGLFSKTKQLGSILLRSVGGYRHCLMEGLGST